MARPSFCRIRNVPWRTLENEVEAWDNLARTASEPNPFFESWYLLPSLRNMPETETIEVLRFERDGELAGILPVARSSRYYRWPVPHLTNWLHANTFCGVPLVARGCEVPFWQAVLDWADEAPGAALFLHLRRIVLGGPMHTALEGLGACVGRRIEIVHQEARAMLASSLSSQAYLEASLPGKKRKELRRQAKRLADQGDVRFERRTDADEVDDWCSRFLALEAAGWKGAAGSSLASDESTTRLFRESLAGAAGRGKLERLTLWLDDRPLAMLATFLTPPGAFSYKTAFDETFARFSPGVLLQRENLAVLDRPEIAWSDSCAAADHPMIDHLWRERRAVGSLSVAIGGTLRRSLFNCLVKSELSRSTARR
ncbi:cellulose biosynthesis protein CelD [Novosphingobium malaysiense]|uniref:Cellulose biosynthesis protein CelD n=1 Tax=Novosphingobium malaysiense TaxID=1348853 RepID=A0A0B1ZS10_9SPHN|nr:cellulose biosynthesis protein CelD [Novosphingobium malaysiense]